MNALAKFVTAETSHSNIEPYSESVQLPFTKSVSKHAFIASENTASVNGKSGGGGVGGGGGEGASHSVRTLLHSVGFIENEVELAHSYFAWNAVADSKIESYKVSKVVFQSPMY